MTPRFEPLLQDLRYAVRGLRRSPAFTITVVLTLALGIGANTAMFGIIDRLMFRPYPSMRDQGSVHRVYLQSTDRGTTSTRSNVGEYTRYLDLRKFTTSFADAAGVASPIIAVGSGDAARERPVGVVSASFFGFFDAPPALGRYFTAAEDTTPRGAEVAVISYAFWQNEFDGRDVRGQPLQVGNIPTVIIGVLPKGFAGIWDANPPPVYIPITTFAGSNPSRSDAETYYTRYNWGWMDMIVRRKPDVSVDAASADLSNAYVKSWDIMREQDGGGTPSSLAKPRSIAGALKIAAGPDPTIEAKTVRWVAGIAIVVLLIACSNVANLFLSRALKRRRETAVRIALGVARYRLVRQWFTESALLALIGCGAGVLIAQWGGSALRALFVGNGAPIPVSTDWRTLGVSAALAVVAALLAGTAPSLVLGRDGVAAALKAGAREGTHRRSRLRTSLLVIQVTLSVVLLVGAGLFVQSFSHVRSFRLGYDVEQVVLIGRNLRGHQLTDSQLATLSRELLAKVQTMPMVERAAAASSIPFMSTSSSSFRVDGIDSVQRLGRFTYQSATEDYFATMDTRILRGRAFTAADRGGSEPVTVVSEAMANVLWPSQDAIGRCIYRFVPNAPCTRVIGVAEDAAQNQLQGSDRFRYYTPLSQYVPHRGNFVLARVRGDVNAASEAIRKALQPLIPGQGYVTTRPMRGVIENQQRAWRFGSTMFLAFGVLALVVASIGLYGVIGYNVAQRMHELGVRIALGARTRHVMNLVLSQGLIVAFVGVALGSGIALALSSRVQPLLFQQSARDPFVYVLVGVTLVIAALAACIVPARRAAKADPNLSLRSD
jgi:predicted permease